MSRNGSGTMSVSNTLVNGTTIDVGPLNTNFTDIGSELTNSLALDGQSQMSGQLKIASGTVAAPGLVPGSDPDTGLYRIGGDNLGVACAGAKVLDIGTAGLDVTGALTVGSAAVYKSGGTDVAIADGGTGASTATAAFDALSPITTRGDLIVGGASNDVRLAVGAADTVLKTDGTDPSWAKIVNANITDTTIAHAKLATAVTATQAIMETGTATDSFVAPGRLQFHPLMPKAWVIYNLSTDTVVASSGVSGVVHNSTGIFTVSFSTNFSGATTYSALGWARSINTTGGLFVSANSNGTKAVGSMSLTVRDTTDALRDSTEVFVAFFGDL